MKNFLLGTTITAFSALLIFYLIDKNSSQKTTLLASNLITEQIKNVGKLVVTEGYFAEVITYKDAKKYYLDWFTAEKKMIVVVNAKATIAYDLSKIEYQLDASKKTVTITQIPTPELSINPTITYHHLEDTFLNSFEAEDHNKIQQQVTQKIEEKVKKSSFTNNAQNRLLSELQKIYILTNSLDWILTYKKQKINMLNDFGL